MKLGIKGHPTRGDEVIKILEMLGGKNRHEMKGTLYDNYFYFISNIYKDIDYTYIGPDEIMGYKIFSLEDFLEKNPYKVGDRVTLDNKLCSIIYMCWECNNIYYQVQGIDIMFTKKVIANELKPYKKKNTNMNTCNDNTTHTEHKKITNISINNEDYANQIEIELGDDYEYKFEMNRLYLVKKKSEYPKTYDECCDKLEFKGGFREIFLSENEYSLYTSFIKLIRCRDAYWKIIGEEMGLDKPWNPDFANFNGEQCYYFITTRYGNIIRTTEYTNDELLVFPYSHKEMAIEFYNNFKLLIESCKELL